MTGPKKIIDLDQLPEERWKVEENALHLHGSRLWRVEKSGCMVCIKNGATGTMAQTLRADDAREFECLTHGELEEIPLKITRKYHVVLGPLHKEAEEKYEDSVLMPKAIPEEQKLKLLEELMAEIDKEEKSSPVVV